MSESLVLVGPMGAGKSTIAKALAQKLQLQLLDIDQMVVDNAGADIPWIFDVEGEHGFRKRETFALQSALAQPKAVIASGGGLVTQLENRQLLAQVKLVVYLKASVQSQFQRTAKDKNRPLLQQSDPQAVLQKLFADREPWYQQVADISIDTDKNNPKEIVQKIVKQWKAAS